MNTALKYAKAIIGAVSPGVVILLNAITSGSDGGSSITSNEWSAAGLAVLVTGGLVALVPNKDKTTPPGV